jgi:lipopolysaccharide export system protein LptA
MLNTKSFHAILGLSLVFCMLSTTHAADATKAKSQPITIEANQLEVDQSKGLSIYRGQVRLTQGTERILADSIHLYSQKIGDKQQITQLIATGKPAKIERPSEGLFGSAQRIEYYPLEKIAKLFGNAHLKQQADTISAEQIEVNLTTQALKANKAQTGNRVTITLEPATK